MIDYSAQIRLVTADGDLTMFLLMGSDGDVLANDLRWLLNRSDYDESHGISTNRD